MKKKFKKDFSAGQTSVEYFILLGMVVVVVLAGVKTFIPLTRHEAGEVFNEVTVDVMGPIPVPRTDAQTAGAPYP